MRYKLKTILISILALILLYSALSFVNAPSSNVFLWSSINPLEFLEGVIFALGFGLGFPMWLSIIVIGLLSSFIFAALLWVVRKVIK